MRRRRARALGVLEGVAAPVPEPQLEAECEGDMRRLQQVRGCILCGSLHRCLKGVSDGEASSVGM